MNDRATDHATHDRLLIAAHAAGDLDGSDLARAERLLSACADCRVLADDLRSIVAALPTAAVPRRPRDFRLRVSDVDARPAADRLSRLQASVDAFRRSLSPVGAGLATIGIAGLLLAGSSGLFGASSGTILSTVGAAVGSPGEARDNAGGAPVPGVASPGASAAFEQRSPAPTAVAGGGEVPSIPTPKPAVPEKVAPVPTPTAPPGPPPLVVGSLAILGLGVLLFAVGRLLRARAGPGE